MFVLKLPKTRAIRADYAIAGSALQLQPAIPCGNGAVEFAAIVLFPRSQ
jgi:hypothetical protein